MLCDFLNFSTFLFPSHSTFVLTKEITVLCYIKYMYIKKLNEKGNKIMTGAFQFYK